MDAFDYVAPQTLNEAYAQLDNGKESLLLAGGTDVIVQLREGRRRCEQVIDLKHVPELMTLRFANDGTLEVGAALPLADVYEDREVARRLPGLVDAASIIGGIQIQSRASLGGNLCNASPAADSSPALMVLGARLLIGSAAGTRDLPVEEFFLGPGQNALRPGELLLQVRIPPQPPRSGAFYLRFIPRNEMDIAVASAGARIQLSASGAVSSQRESRLVPWRPRQSLQRRQPRASSANRQPRKRLPPPGARRRPLLSRSQTCAAPLASASTSRQSSPSAPSGGRFSAHRRHGHESNPRSHAHQRRGSRLPLRAAPEPARGAPR